jgi:aspartate/methionine/tyrosine aminotransferase
MTFADRVRQLGTETAFAVSAEAAAFAAAGNRVFPFHIGDLNIATPQNISDAAARAIADRKTGYCPNAGIPELREALAFEINATHGTSYNAGSVAVQPGGKPVISKFIQVLMNPGDEVLYPNPGFPIYESMIEFHGGTAVPYRFVEGEQNFTVDLDQMERQISGKTRLLIWNDLQNPTAAEATEEEIERVAQIALRHDLAVLCDEAYYDVRFGGVSRSLASLPGMAERSVILYTFSKKYAMTGWRLGAALGPNSVIDVIAKLNVNDESCTSHFTQWAGVEALRGEQSAAREIMETLRGRRDVAVKLLNEIPGVRCFSPDATFYLFPNATELMRMKGFDSYEEFRRAALKETGVSFCTRLHYGRAGSDEAERYIRFAYSGIDVADIREGLGRLKSWAE